MKTAKKKFKMPNAYTLIIMFIIVSAIATFIVPAGVYDTYLDDVTGKKLVDSTTYHQVERTPVGISGFLLSIPQGMMGAASMIFLVFLIGGFFQIINDTGAIDAAINVLVEKLQDKSFLVIPIVMAIMSVLGALGIIVNAVIAFIPIGIALAKKLKIDPVAGMAIMYLGAFTGTTTTPMGYYNTMLAQTISGLEPLSGFAFRSVVWFIVFVVTVIYVLRYSKKVKSDVNNSVLEDYQHSDHSEFDVESPKFNWRHGIVLVALVAGFSIYSYGSFKLKWGIDYLSATMLAVALISGIVTKMHPDDMSISFIEGCKSMVFGALVIGFAKSITIVLTDGQIIHSIIHYMSIPLQQLPSALSAVCMFYVNLIFNFFVPSGSGQAMIVMPLQAPLADVVHVSRQVAVSAYLYGDGFSNTIIPTSGVLMGALGVAKIPWDKWLKFQLPLFGMWTLIGTVAIAVGVLIGWA
ncbi:YfcC family protein [Fusibacter ferrireducens]|uniref:YfcC family protein n=1 Tax=Fusibacter ferrireducens TaxID=2785058 RepID=A0ABR9ZPX7_9FIRM|nr:YfcC family protein [Fusibacter ferrireducens]MBF4692525.1 YfcC family protein [Fusibacter ferrireducens]